MAWQRIRIWRRRLLCRQYHTVNFWEYNYIKQYSRLQCQTDIFTAFNLVSWFTSTPIRHNVFFNSRIPVVLLGRVPTPCTLPIDLPLLTHHFTGKPVVASWNVGCSSCYIDVKLRTPTLYASIFPFTCWFFSSAFSMQSFVYNWGFLPWSMYLHTFKYTVEHC